MSHCTVAAISTPAGEGGIGVIRISGDDAIAVADRCFKAVSKKPLSTLSGYSAAFGQVICGDEVLDDAVALVFRAPKSYTGEDVVEISVHGGAVMVKSVLRAVLDSGAYLAEGGEFTKRAFLNGKLDLAKAESVMELISAKSDAALKISRAAHGGRVSREIEDIIAKLLQTAASLAAYSDYPDEDIEGLDFDSFLSLLSTCEDSLSKLLINFDAGKLLREGIDCVIVGKPNVGKSTLMNLLCGSDRSIVTSIAGTTRDVVESSVTVGNIILNLADTAGIHDTADEVERVGVQRALSRLENASLTLAVFDTSIPLSDDDDAIIEKIRNERAIVILNKTDLDCKIDHTAFDGLYTVELSAKSGEGIKALEQAIGEVTSIAKLSADDAVLISERQRSCANRAYEAVKQAKDTLIGGFTLDAVGVCVDDAVAALLELTGKRVTNEVTDEVFRRFCVGK